MFPFVAVKVRPYCVGVDILVNSMAIPLVIYSEFWYLSWIFHSLFYKLISIFIFFLHTFSMGEKTSARLHRERTVRRRLASSVLSASYDTRRRIVHQGIIVQNL